MLRISAYYITIGCVLTLILLVYICFKYLFPMIGQWIVDLNCKLQKRILKLKVDEDNFYCNKECNRSCADWAKCGEDSSDS